MIKIFISKICYSVKILMIEVLNDRRRAGEPLRVGKRIFDRVVVYQLCLKIIVKELEYDIL